MPTNSNAGKLLKPASFNSLSYFVFLQSILFYLNIFVLPVMVLFLPFLVFEVLEGQVYNFLDESIQERMEGDLDRETKFSRYFKFSLSFNRHVH